MTLEPVFIKLPSIEHWEPLLYLEGKFMLHGFGFRHLFDQNAQSSVFNSIAMDPILLHVGKRGRIVRADHELANFANRRLNRMYFGADAADPATRWITANVAACLTDSHVKGFPPLYLTMPSISYKLWHVRSDGNAVFKNWPFPETR